MLKEKNTADYLEFNAAFDETSWMNAMPGIFLNDTIYAIA